MAHEFRLPDIGEGLTEAEVVRWLVAVGDPVGVDEPLVEVETDKAVVDIPSPYAGTVLRHGAAEGEVLAVGAVLVVIGTPDEALGSPDRVDEPPEAAPRVVESAAPIVGTLDEEAGEMLGEVGPPPPDPPSPSTGATRPQALPLVRKLARELGVDLAAIEPTGPHGRVTREDVERAARAATPVVGERRQMSKLRRTIAANMERAWREIPHVTTFDDAVVRRLLEVRDALARRHGAQIPLDAFLVKAVVPVVQALPEFNASVDGDDLVVRPSVDVGLAVDTPDGLLVAVIRSAESLSILELASEVRRLGEGARARTLSPSELSGQSFTVSNIGAVGGGHGTPIIPPGTTAILSAGRAADRPVVEDGQVVVAPVMPLSLSFDHRVIDGALGRRFMAMLIENLSEPALFLA